MSLLNVAQPAVHRNKIGKKVRLQIAVANAFGQGIALRIVSRTTVIIAVGIVYIAYITGAGGTVAIVFLALCLLHGADIVIQGLRILAGIILFVGHGTQLLRTFFRQHRGRRKKK